MILLPKEFDIDIAKLDKRFSAITSSNYDGVCKNGLNFTVMWKIEPNNIDLAAIENYWNSLTEQSYNAMTESEQYAAVSKILEEARIFGGYLVVSFARDNIIGGITQAGKTRAVADYCYKIQYYLSTGSLYAALEEAETILADQNKDHLAPFVTNERITLYKHKIQDYLKIPRT